VFENRALRRIFGPKRDEVTGEWRQLQNGELYNLYSSPNIIMQMKSRENEVGRACGTHGRREKSCKVLVEKPKGRRPLGRSRRRLEDGIKMDLRDTGWGGGVGVDSPSSE
jgi:hypothetical protein